MKWSSKDVLRESFPGIENFMEDFRYQIPVCTLQEGIEIVSNIKYLTELHKIPQAAGLQFRQLIQGCAL
ncbi:hypothetical protein NC653_004649 [Populus alba x Populus x berolinensis]|uniref:Uncharacterized protein n=1 Tax=Populus alba x Populus x berolinensis TaxID=444605 RepID=A0AAD6RV11_9ROSI|nr:hypothetical protein NC653_004649 [Populus alba x Populus x berolinensis]